MDDEATSAISGAISGATSGSMFGPMGTIIGGVAGLTMGLIGSSRKKKAQEQLLKANLEEQRLRQQQMEYDALRQSRMNIRNFQAGESIAKSNQVMSGAIYGSAAGGAKGQQQGQFGTTAENIFENLQIGRGIFAAQAAQGYAKARIGDAQGLESLGHTLSTIGPTAGRVAGGIFGGNSGANGTSGNTSTSLDAPESGHGLY